MSDKLTFGSLTGSDAWKDMVKERDYDSASSVLDGIERRIQSDMLNGLQNGSVSPDQIKAIGAATRQRKRELMNEVYGNKVFDTSLNASYRDLLDSSGEKSSTAAFEAFIENDILPNEMENLAKGFQAFKDARDQVDIGSAEDFVSADIGLHDKYEGTIVRAANLYDRMNGGSGNFETLDQVYKANTSGDFNMDGMDAMYNQAKRRVSSRVANDILDPKSDVRKEEDGAQVFVKDGVAMLDKDARTSDELKSYIDPAEYIANVRNSNVSVGEAFKGALYHDVVAMGKLNEIRDTAIKGGKSITGFGDNDVAQFMQDRRSQYQKENGYSPNDFEEAKFAIDYIDEVSEGGVGQYLEDNVGRNFFSRLATGYESALSLLGSREDDSLRTGFWQTFMGTESGEDFSRFLSGVAEETKETREARKKTLQSAGKHNFVDDAIGLSGDLAHTLITMTGTGGAATIAGAGPKLTKAATVGSAMFSEGTSTYVDSRDNMYRLLLEKGMEEGEAWDNAAQAAIMPTAGAVLVTGALGGFGTSGAVTDALSGNAVKKATVGDIIKAAGSQKAFKKNIMDLVDNKDFMNQLSSSVQRQLNNGNLTMRRMLGERGKRLAADFGEEAIEEGLVGAFTEIGNALGKVDHGIDPNLNFMDFVESVAYQAAVGGVFGSIANPAVGRIGDGQFKFIKESDVTKQREKIMDQAQLQTLIYTNEKAQLNGEISKDEEIEAVADNLERSHAPKTAEAIRKKANIDDSIPELETLTDEEAKGFFGEEEGNETGIPSSTSRAATEKDATKGATHPIYGEGEWAESELGGKVEYKKVGKVNGSDVSQAYYKGKPTDQFFSTKDGSPVESVDPIDSDLVKPATYTAEDAKAVKSKANKKGTSDRVEQSQNFYGKLITPKDTRTLASSSSTRPQRVAGLIKDLAARILPNPRTGKFNIKSPKGVILGKANAEQYIKGLRGEISSNQELGDVDKKILNRAVDKLEARVNHLYDEGGDKLVFPEVLGELKGQLAAINPEVQEVTPKSEKKPTKKYTVKKQPSKDAPKPSEDKAVKNDSIKSSPKKTQVKAAQDLGQTTSKEGGATTLSKDSPIEFSAPTGATPAQVELDNVKNAGYDPDFVNSHVLVPHGSGYVGIENRGTDKGPDFGELSIGELINDNEIIVDIINLPEVVDSRPDGTVLGSYNPVQIISLPVENDVKTDGYAIAQSFLNGKFSTIGNLTEDGSNVQFLYDGTTQDSVEFAQNYVNVTAPHLNIEVEEGSNLGFRMDGDRAIITISSRAINQFSSGHQNADSLIAHIAKAMDEEVVHAATMRSFISSEGGIEAAFQKLENIGRGLWEKNLDKSVPYAFVDDSKTPEGYVRNAMEFLNIQVQRVRTGRSTADIAVNKNGDGWKNVLKSYIEKARDAYKAFNRLFSNPEYSDYVKNINNYLNRGENLPTIADRVQKETEDAQKAASEARERARLADLREQSQAMQREIRANTNAKERILDNPVLDDYGVREHVATINTANEELARGARLGYGSIPGVVGLDNNNRLVIKVEEGVNYPSTPDQALEFQAGVNAPLLPTYPELQFAVDAINESGFLDSIGVAFNQVQIDIQNIKDSLNRPDLSNEEILSGSFLQTAKIENEGNEAVVNSIDALISDYSNLRENSGVVDVLTQATSRPMILDTMQLDVVRKAEERGFALGLLAPITFSGVDITTSHLTALSPLNIYQMDEVVKGNRAAVIKAPVEFYQDLTSAFYKIWNRAKTAGAGFDLTFKEIEQFLSHKNIGEIYSKEELDMMNDILNIFKPIGKFADRKSHGGHSVALMPLLSSGKLRIPSLTSKASYSSNIAPDKITLDEVEQGRSRSRRVNSIANAMAVDFMNQVFDGRITPEQSKAYDNISPESDSDAMTRIRSTYDKTTSTSESLPMPSPAGKKGEPNDVWVDETVKFLKKFRKQSVDAFFEGDYEQYKDMIFDHLRNGTSINSSNQALKIRDNFLKALRGNPIAYYANDLQRLANIYKKSGKKADYDNFYFSAQRVSDIISAFKRNKRSIAYKALEPDNVDSFFGLTYSNDVLNHVNSYKYDYELNGDTVTYVRWPSAVEMVKTLGGRLDSFDSTNFGIDLNRQLKGFEDTVERARLPEDNQLADAISRKGVDNLNANYRASKNRTILAYYLFNRDSGAVRKFFAGYRNNAEGANSALLDMLHDRVAKERDSIESDALSAFKAEGIDSPIGAQDGDIPLIDPTGKNSPSSINLILEYLNNNTGDRNNPDVQWNTFSQLVNILDEGSIYRAVAEPLISSYGNLPVAFYRGAELNRNLVGYNTSGILTTPQNFEEQGVSKPQIGLVDVYSTHYESGGVESFEKLVRDLFKTSLETRISPEFHQDINEFKSSFNKWLNESLNTSYNVYYSKKKAVGNDDVRIEEPDKRRTRLLRLDKHLTKYLTSKGIDDQAVDFSNVDNAEFVADLLFDKELGKLVAEAGLDIQDRFSPSNSGDSISFSASNLAERIINDVEIESVDDYRAVEAENAQGYDPSFTDDAEPEINEIIPVGEGIDASPYDTRALEGLIEATLRDLNNSGVSFSYELDPSFAESNLDVIQANREANRDALSEANRKPNQISFTSFLTEDVIAQREKEGHNRVYWNILRSANAYGGDGNYSHAYGVLHETNKLTEGDRQAYADTYEALLNSSDIADMDSAVEVAEKARQTYMKALDDVSERAAGTKAGLMFSDNYQVDSDLVKEALRIGIKKGQKGSMSRRVMIANASAGIMSRIDRVTDYFRSIHRLPTDKNYDGSVETLRPEANELRKDMQKVMRQEMDDLLNILGDGFPLIEPLNQAVDSIDKLYYEYGEIKNFDVYDKFFPATDYIYMNDVVDFMDSQVDEAYNAPSAYTNIYEAAFNREIPISDQKLSDLITLKNNYDQSLRNIPNLPYNSQEELAQYEAQKSAVKHWMNRENELLKTRRRLRGTSSTVNRLVKGQLIPADKGFAKLVERKGFSAALDQLLNDDQLLKSYLKQIDAQVSAVTNQEFSIPFYAPTGNQPPKNLKWSDIDNQVSDDAISPEVMGQHIKLHLGADFPIASRRLEQLVKKAVTLKSQNYSDLNSDIEAHKMIKDEIDYRIAIASQLGQSSETSDLVNRASNTALLELASTGDYRSFMRMFNAVWSAYTFDRFAKNSVVGVNAKVAANIATARLEDQSSRSMRAYSRSSQAQQFIANELGILDHGFSGRSGRYGSDNLMTKYSKKVVDLLKPIKNVEDASKTYAAAISTNYAPDVTALKNFKRNLDLIERGAQEQNNAINSPSATVPLKLAFKKEMQAQQKGVARIVRLLKNFEANTNFNRSNEEVFADLDRFLEKSLAPAEVAAIKGFRDIFKEMEAVVEHSAIMRGRPIGNIKNYVPVSSYDPRVFMEMLIGKVMTDTPEGAHARTRFSSNNVNAIDFNPFRTVLKTLSNMTYAANTRSAYNYFGDVYGASVTGQDAGISKHYMNQIYNSNKKGIPYKDQVKIEASLAYLKSEAEVLRNNDYNNAVNDHPLAKSLNMMINIGYRQALTSVEQLVRQSAPVMVSYLATNPKKAITANNAAMKLIASAAAGSLQKGKAKALGNTADTDNYFDNLKDKMEKFFPKIASRGIDGLNEMNKLFESDKLFANPSVLRKVAEGGKDAVKFIDKASNFISKVVVGTPDAVMLWAIVDAEYKSATGKSLADITDSEVDINAATQAKIIAETYLAQSDTSKKGAWFQKQNGFVKDTSRKMLVSWANVQASLTARAGAGVSMMINGEDAQTKKDGFSLLANNLIQSFVYNALNVRNFAYIFAAALAMGDEEEMRKIQSNLHKMFSYDIGPLARSQKNNLDSDMFFYSYGVKSVTDAVGGFIPGKGVWTTLNAINELIRDGATNVIDSTTDIEAPDYEFKFGNTYDWLNRIGPAGNPIANALKLGSSYAFGTGGSYVGKTDLAALAAMFIGDRETLEYRIREIQERNGFNPFEKQGYKWKPSEDFLKYDFYGLKWDDSASKPNTIDPSLWDFKKSPLSDRQREIAPVEGYIAPTDISAGWSVVNNPKIVSDLTNDGDSFMVINGDQKFKIRLYGVDTVESSLQLTDNYSNVTRVGQQASGLGDNLVDSLAKGRDAAIFTADLLENGNPTLITQNQSVIPKDRGTYKDRRYAHIEVDWQGGRALLSEILIKEGLAHPQDKDFINIPSPYRGGGDMKKRFMDIYENR